MTGSLFSAEVLEKSSKTGAENETEVQPGNEVDHHHNILIVILIKVN